MLQSIRSFSVTFKNSFAKAQLLGTVGSVYVRETKANVKYISYSLAVNGYQEETDWFIVSVFDKRHISFFEKFLKPGMQLYVEAVVKQNVVDEASSKNYYLKQKSFEIIRFSKKETTETEEESQGLTV